MPDGLTIAAFALLVGLLYAWALQARADDRVADIEEAHTTVRRFQAILDRVEEYEYRHDLRVDLELAAMLDDKAAA